MCKCEYIYIYIYIAHSAHIPTHLMHFLHTRKQYIHELQHTCDSAGSHQAKGALPPLRMTAGGNLFQPYHTLLSMGRRGLAPGEWTLPPWRMIAGRNLFPTIPYSVETGTWGRLFGYRLTKPKKGLPGGARKISAPPQGV